MRRLPPIVLGDIKMTFQLQFLWNISCFSVRRWLPFLYSSVFHLSTLIYGLFMLNFSSAGNKDSARIWIMRTAVNLGCKAAAQKSFILCCKAVDFSADLVMHGVMFLVSIASKDRQTHKPAFMKSSNQRVNQVSRERNRNPVESFTPTHSRLFWFMKRNSENKKDILTRQKFLHPHSCWRNQKIIWMNDHFAIQPATRFNLFWQETPSRVTFIGYLGVVQGCCLL